MNEKDVELEILDGVQQSQATFKDNANKLVPISISSKQGISNHAYSLSIC